MENFEFYVPTKVVFGRGTQSRVGELVKEFGGASAVMFQQIWRGEKLLTELEVIVVYLSLNKKRPVRIPQEMAAAIEKL